MFKVIVFLSCVALCFSHAVLPVPAVYSAPLVAPLYAGHGAYSHGVYGHGLYGHGGYGHGLYGHGYAQPLAHHLYKRSPHYATPLAHIAPVAALAPVAVSHQSRVDLKTPLVAPAVFPGVYGAGYFGAGHLGAGHLGYGHHY